MNAKRLRALLCAVAALPAVLSPDLAMSASPNPTVTVVNTTANPVPVTGSITVGNTVVPVEVSNADPIPVSVVTGPAVQPFQHASIIGIDAGTLGDKAEFTVPAGKRLVIEFVSFHVSIPPGQRVSYLWVAVDVAGSNVVPMSHYFVPVFLGTGFGGTSDEFTASSPTRLYADPGTTVEFAVRRNSATGGGLASVSMSGYLEDVP